jgi:hypothetical protein
MEMLWEASIAHGASECFWPRLFRAEVVPFAIVTASAAWVSHTVLGLYIVVLQVVLVMHLGFQLSAWMTQLVVG